MIPKKFSKSHINIKEWEFEFQQRNEHPILMADLFCRSLYEQFPKEIRLNIDGYDYFFTSSSRGYVKRSQKKRVIGALRKAAWRATYLNFVLKTSIKRMEEFDALADSINAEIQQPNLSKKRLSELWTFFDHFFQTVIPWFFIPWYLSEENIITDRVKEKLAVYKAKIEKIADINTALLTLVFPVKKAAFQEEQEDLFELVSLAERYKNFERNAMFLKKSSQYLEKYAWMKTFLLLPLAPLTGPQLVSKIRDAIARGPRAEFELQQKARVKDAKTAQRVMRAVQHDKKLLQDIAWARELGWVLTASVEQAMRASAKLLDFMKVVARHIGVPYKNLRHLVSEEIILSLKKDLKIDRSELAKRAKGFIFFSTSGSTRMAVGEAGKRLSDWVDSSTRMISAEVHELKGQPASGGHAKGKVRIALTPKESYSLKDGEILVCPMTGPDYVPAMKRSAAIITDEGGLLSHAAIMSREFGKPCIVATRIATQVLKDGDLIEVDANNGIVKVVKI